MKEKLQKFVEKQGGWFYILIYILFFAWIIFSLIQWNSAGMPEGPDPEFY